MLGKKREQTKNLNFLGLDDFPLLSIASNHSKACWKKLQERRGINGTLSKRHTVHGKQSSVL